MHARSFLNAGRLIFLPDSNQFAWNIWSYIRLDDKNTCRRTSLTLTSLSSSIQYNLLPSTLYLKDLPLLSLSLSYLSPLFALESPSMQLKDFPSGVKDDSLTRLRRTQQPLPFGENNRTTPTIWASCSATSFTLSAFLPVMTMEASESGKHRRLYMTR